MAEWSKAPVWRAGWRVTVTRVRIPISPQKLRRCKPATAGFFCVYPPSGKLVFRVAGSHRKICHKHACGLHLPIFARALAASEMGMRRRSRAQSPAPYIRATETADNQLFNNLPGSVFMERQLHKTHIYNNLRCTALGVGKERKPGYLPAGLRGAIEGLSSACRG